MSWPERMEPALRAYIEERQATVLATYENDPDLLIEHVRQEESFRTGGYGTRQISELLQNAVDAIGLGSTGTVELRLAGGALYCANEGQGFSRDGVRAVTHAFLSSKRGDEIGRFGLGFKSVLGVSDHPQIFSHTVSFEFNAPGTAELFAGIPHDGGRLPLLRMPTLASPETAAAQDPHLAELMEWATTVVKLPLTREGARLRKELEAFSPESLLFFKPLDRLRISLEKVDETVDETEFAREGHPEDGQVVISAPGVEPTKWLYAEREYRPSEAVAATLPSTALRESMTVSYAVRPEGRAGVGRLWAWFPLRDETTASGVFNAPWQVNDDRTSLVAGSALNDELLDVATDLFLDVVARASTPEDLGAHLDLFPARGKEARSWADRYLSEAIPRQAMRRPMIPDVTGTLRGPRAFTGIPDLGKTPITADAAELWQRNAPRNDMPHWQCFTTPTRRLRLRTLLGGTDSERSNSEVTLARWLEELAHQRDTGSVEAAVAIAALLAPKSPELRDEVTAANVVPLESGGWASLSATRAVFIPSDGVEVPEGIETLAQDFTASEPLLHDLSRLGFRKMSAADSVVALAPQASDDWEDTDWGRFWAAARAAAPGVAEDAIRSIRESGVGIKVPTRAGTWRRAREILIDGGFAARVRERHVDTQVVPSLALLHAAGAIEGPDLAYPLEHDSLLPGYRGAVESMVKATLVEEGFEPAAPVEVSVSLGLGPLDVLADDLTDGERASWTKSLLAKLSGRETTVRVKADERRTAEITVPTFEWWAIRRYGQVMTSLGMRPVERAAPAGLQRFATFLPVPLDDPESGTPAGLDTVPVGLLVEFLKRDGYPIPESDFAAFAELMRHCCSRTDITTPDTIPAVLNGRVVLVDRIAVALIDRAAEIMMLDDNSVAYIPTMGDHGELIDSWGATVAREALQQWPEFVGVGDPTPVLDLYPSLQSTTSQKLSKQVVVRAESISLVVQSINGSTKRPLRVAKHDGVVYLDASLDAVATLDQISKALGLGLTYDDVQRVIREDEALRRTELITRAQLAKTHEERLLILVGAETLRQRLPKGLLPAVESRRSELSDGEIAELFLQVYGHDAVRELRFDLTGAGVKVPDKWDGSPSAQSAVKSLGFDTAYAGIRESRPASVTQVQGRIVLNELHDYQQDLADQIVELASTADESKRRGLLYLPTGAGKTRVTVEALLRLLKDGGIEAPLLWIAQSEELCEQAITAFAEVWRWMGDERPLDVSRFWSGHELDESKEELQVVVAIDDTLASRLREPYYDWLTRPGMVVIDEAHTAGTKTYTEILSVLGLTARKTERPLLGLTATPFRGRNAELNRQFVARFGSNRLEALDPEDPIGELRRRKVLSEVDYDILTGVSVSLVHQDQEFRTMKEVSKSMLSFIGQDMGRTLNVVEHIRKLVTANSDWPVLVFAASVASAHTIAALLRLEDVRADSVDGNMRKQQRRRVVEGFKSGDSQVLVNCDLLTQGFDAPKVRALYIARPTFSPNRYLQMVGRGLRGEANGGTDRCLIVNVADTFEQFGEELAYNEFDYLWSKK